MLESKEVPDPDEIIQRDSEKCMIQKFVRQPHFTMKTDEGVIDGCYMLAFLQKKLPEQKRIGRRLSAAEGGKQNRNCS